MSAFSLTDATVLVHDQDFSGYANTTTLAAEAEALESTTFRSGGARARVAGLKTTQLDVSGFWDPAPDASVFADLEIGNMLRAVTIAPTNTQGDTAYMFRAGYFSYSQLGDVGAIAPFSLSMMNTNREGLIRGKYLKRPTDNEGTAENTTATGVAGSAGVQLAAVSSGQYLYATFHVLTAGTTITAVLESDDANTFGSATTRITFGPITTTGGTWGTRVAGPVTDTWYRLRVTAITGTFKIACAVGIG
jgi:hypothetical protein